MRLVVVLLLAAVVSCGWGGGATDEGFALIHVGDLVGLLNSPAGAATVLDANGSDFRTREGVLPGAILLSSYSKYDVEKELPSRKDTRLVFYCADSH